MLKRLAAWYADFIDGFVPEAMSQDMDRANQARMFMISHSMGPILGNSVPLALFLFDPTPSWHTLVLALSITGFWVFPFLLKRGVNYDHLVLGSVLNLHFAILWSCYHNGGVASPTLPWVLVIPLLSFFYIGGEQRLQNKLLLMSAACYGSFVLAYYTTSPPPNDIADYALVSLGVVSTVAALAYVATMAIYYSRIFDAGVKLEEEVRRRRKASDELRQAVSHADRLSVLKSDFLARMSHELRTPLNAVIGYSDMLKEEALLNNDMQLKQDTDKIHDAGQYLLRMINMILDLSKIEAGRMQFKAQKVDLKDLVAGLLEANRSELEASGNTIQFEATDKMAICQTDRSRLEQILETLLQNAGQYSEDGQITCSVQPDNDRSFLISVRDTGIGISPERLAVLFQVLTDDERDAASGRFGGTGLRLTVAHAMASAMQCELSAESTEGVGTTFYLRVPELWIVSEPSTPSIAGPDVVADDKTAIKPLKGVVAA